MKPAFDIADKTNLVYENPAKAETRTAKWKTDFADDLDISERSICGA